MNRLQRGLWLAAIIGAFGAFVAALMWAMYGIVAIWRWNPAAGWVAGIFGVLLFAFLLGAFAEWDDGW